jgi:integrase
MATIDQRPGPDGKLVYRVRVRRKGTPTQTSTFTKLADAKQWAQMIAGRVLEGRHFPSMKPTRHTVSETIERYLCEILPHKSANTRYNQRYQLQWWSKQLGPSALRDLTPDLLSQWRDALAKTRAPASVRAYFSVLSHVLTITVKEWGWLRDNPMHNVRMPRIPRGRVRYLSEDARQRLLNACKGSRNPWLYTVVVLALSTGARKMELRRLRWPDVDVQRQVITLHETKNGERCVLPLTGHAWDLLQYHALHRRTDTELLFPRQRELNKPMDIREAWESTVKRAGITDFRFHDLRHSCASYLAMRGASLAEIAEVLGHKTLQMTKRYTHLSEAHTRGVVERMNRAVFGE